MTWDDIEKLQDKYEEMFDDVFPTAPFKGKTVEELAGMIEKCIHENKDAYDIGLLSLDNVY